MKQKQALSIALLFLGGSTFLAGSYGVVSMFSFWKPGIISGVIQTALLFSIAVGLVIAGTRFWDRWGPALAVILVLLGFGSMQTSPQSQDPKLDALSSRAFKISGGLLVATGATIYLLTRRR